MRSVTAADANRYFSKLLREVDAGDEVTIISDGEPVARIIPLKADERARVKLVEAERQLAWENFLTELKSRPPLGIPITWSRDELYDDDF